MSKKYILIPVDLSVRAAKDIGLKKVACSGRGNKKYFASRDEADTYRIDNMSPPGRYRIILYS